MVLRLLNKNIPQKPGVYFFKNKAGKILYIGKANNLRARLQSYRSRGSYRTEQLLKEARILSWETLQSETEALIRESELIKKYRPKYNIVMRDDKQYLYVGFTKEKYPKVFTTHQPLQNQKSIRQLADKNQNGKLSTTNYQLQTTFIGPFTDAGALRTVLKSLRRVFPYCTCLHPHKTPCLNTRIGRCMGFCCVEPTRLSSRFPRSPQRGSRGDCSELAQEQSDRRKVELALRSFSLYEKTVPTYLLPANKSGLKTRFDDNLVGSYQINIRAIKKILSGKNKSLVRELKKEMQTLSKARRYEEAARVRNQIQALERIFAHKSVLKNDIPSERQKALRALEQLLYKKINGGIHRIEGYDISNIHGKYAYGSMVVFINGVPKKDEYRIFRIRGNTIAPHRRNTRRPNDTAMIHEVISRRLTHREWQLPCVMLIDGGKAQLGAARLAIDDGSRISITFIAVVALAKREEELYIPGHQRPIKLKKSAPALFALLTHIRDEAHRFAIKHYRAAHQKVVGSRTSDNY